MAKIYAIRESGMSPKDIPTKGYNNENINPAKKMSCAGGPGREGSSPREIKNNTSEPVQNQNSDVSKKRIHRNSTKNYNPDVSSSQNLSNSSQVYQIKQPALPHTSNSKRISAQIIVKYIGIPQNRQSRCIQPSKTEQIIVKDI